VELEASTALVRETADRLRLASEAAGFGTYDYDPAAGQLYWSPYLRRMAGIEGDEPLTLDRALSVVHPDHHDIVRRHIDDYSPEEGRRELEFKIVRPDGEVRWLLDRGQAVPGPQGRGLRAMGTILDITERKQNEERQRMLMAELDHRVKNILGNVMAMARLSSRSAQSVTAFIESLDGRIQAISSAHGLLRRGAWVAANLHDLVAASLSPYQSASNIEIQGESVSIVPELAQSMALILHELATNAVKHGALAKPGGHVRVSWSRAELGQLQVLWQETGGQKTTPPTTQGFGLTVLRTAASDLGATASYSFTDQGFVYTLQGPFEIRERGAAPFGQSSTQGDRSTATETATASLDQPMSSCRILVVEDETLVALQLQGDLEDDGHHVIGPATSLKQGLTLAEQEDIDAALVDVRLGRETSAAIADRLLARNIPFAFATGYSDVTMLPDHLRQMPKLGKPYVIGDMRRILGSLIAQGKRLPKVV
jgi:PAS domain S-box-containing protein